MNDEIPLAPLAGWQCAPISAYGAVMLRLSYLLHPMQRVEEAQHTPSIVMTAKQCQELIEALQAKLSVLESGPAEGTGLSRH